MATAPNSNTIIRNQTYLNRDFESIKADLTNLLKIYYPAQYADFSSASVGMSLVDLLAYVSDLLGYHTDKKFNEMFLETAEQTTSLFRIAKNLGYKTTGVKPAVTIVDFSITVPSTANGPDITYLPVYRQGVQIKGAASIFETSNDMDFSSDFSADGIANRKIVPNFDSNQNVINYTITKREKAKAGQTKIFSTDISVADSQTPFFEVMLSNTNVLEILNVIVKPSTGYAGNPSFSDFANFAWKYWEVDELPQDKIFTTDTTIIPDNGVSIGNYVTVNQRFVSEFMADGTCKIIFGGGDADNNAYENYIQSIPINATGQIKIQDIVNNLSLGAKLSTGTLYIQYRVGGGSNSNIGSNVLNSVSNINAVIMGSDTNINQKVIASTTATNIVAGLGGNDLQSADDLRYAISGTFAAQRRCVTLLDYITRAYSMPGKFGAPFKIHGEQRDNKIILYILSKDANGLLMTTSLSTIKSNLISYMEPYRMLNDFIEINDGKVINLSIEADLFTDKSFNANDIKLAALNVLSDFFDINKWNLNENIYVSQVTDALKQIPGVINVIDVRFYNMDGGNYSSTLVAQANGLRELVQGNTYRTQISYLDNAIYSTPISIFEVRYKQADFKIRVN